MRQEVTDERKDQGHYSLLRWLGPQYESELGAISFICVQVIENFYN